MWLFDVLFVAYIVVVAYGVGGRVLTWIRPPYLEEERGRGVFAVGLGLAVISYLVFFLGIFALLNKWSIISLLFLLSVIAFWRNPAFRKRKEGKKDIPYELLIFLPWFITVLLTTLSPPIDWDGLAYHLAVPKLYLLHHKIYWVKFIHHSNFPFLMEMLYTIPLSLGLTDACKLFHFTFALLIMWLLYLQFAEDNKIGGILALLFLTQMVLFSWESTIAYNDLTFSFYVLLSLVAFVRGEILLSGLAIGLAMGTKHLAISFLITLCVLLPFYKNRKFTFRKYYKSILHDIGILLLPAILLALPWYLKSYIYTGNPVYPFFYELFGGKYWSKEAASAYREAQLSIGTGRNILSFILLPWNLTFHPGKFFDPGANPYFVLIGPAFLAFLPLLFLEPFYLAFISLSCIQWFLLSQNIRYALPILVVLPLPLVKRLLRLWRRPFSIIVLSLLLVSYLVHLFIFGLMMYPTWKVVLGLEEKDEFIQRVFPTYNVYKFINENLPKEAKIALLGEPRGFYLDREYIWADPGHHTLIPYEKFKTPWDMLLFYKKMGFSYVLVNRRFARGNPQSSKPIDKFLLNPYIYSEEVYNYDDVYLFKIK